MGRVVKGRYELEREIAEGPLARLWRGRLRADAGFSRPVAVRQLLPRYGKDPRFVGTWAAAAAELATVAGPSVEQVLDLVTEDERVYVVSEWVEGLSLRRWLDAAGADPVDWALAARVGVGVLHGLARPHTRSPALIHGGITPSAVRVSEDGTVKLMRYGAPAALAASGGGRREAEASGLWHRAPEIAAGEGVTPASDQLGVGATLFELLAGVPAFADAEALARGEARDLAAERPDAPPLLVAHIERALRKEPADRFDSVVSMARAIEQLVRTTGEGGDRATLAKEIRRVRERLPTSSSTMVAGPAALAASLRSMTGSPAPQERAERDAETEAETEGEGSAKPKVPVGLPENRTIAVSVSELKEIKVGDPEPEPTEKKRYKFTPKDRSATEKVAEEKSLGLQEQESEAVPLPLTKSKKPKGLAPAKTEFLDEGQVDDLTIGRPQGLAPAKTEFLDESQVDRLTIGNLPKKKKKKRRKKKKKGKGDKAGAKGDGAEAKANKRPLGLSPSKTEFLAEDEVDQLEIDE